MKLTTAIAQATTLPVNLQSPDAAACPNPGETLSSDAVWEDSRLLSVRETGPFG